MTRATAFQPDYERYEGVRPIQILLLRLGYMLVFGFVGYRSWIGILGHRGDWEPYLAVAASMWASSSTLSLIGVFRPLSMLPLVLFEITSTRTSRSCSPPPTTTTPSRRSR